MTGNQLVEIVSLKNQRRQVRVLRVGWHDTRALLNEFRKPLFVFFFALIVGGFVYWYLNNTFSDNEALELIDMPYYMLAFMVLESSITSAGRALSDRFLVWFALGGGIRCGPRCG